MDAGLTSNARSNFDVIELPLTGPVNITEISYTENGLRLHARSGPTSDYDELRKESP
jgi:hypothetical protein